MLSSASIGNSNPSISSILTNQQVPFYPFPYQLEFVHLFNFQVHYILQEVVMGGMVLETNMNEIVAQVELQNRMEKSEVSMASYHLFSVNPFCHH